MGMKQLPKRSGEFLFEIVMRRHELRSTMVTSNRPLEDWGKLLGDVPSATAILDRFLQSTEVIQITGRSFRMRGRKADKQSTEPVAEELENEPKTGKRAHRVGRKRRPKTSKLDHFSPKTWPVLTRPQVAGFNAPTDTLCRVFQLRHDVELVVRDRLFREAHPPRHILVGPTQHKNQLNAL
jgi:hypothetical protein